MKILILLTVLAPGALGCIRVHFWNTFIYGFDPYPKRYVAIIEIFDNDDFYCKETMENDGERWGMYCDNGIYRYSFWTFGTDGTNGRVEKTELATAKVIEGWIQDREAVQAVRADKARRPMLVLKIALVIYEVPQSKKSEASLVIH
ncbi:hypothetical protein OPT61_g2072 [Boeremia exigua]|uniref:Uncharacterized protein n=1 Tax=Boeremia exigua TaxID=749465 RepID=A0ACC2IN12_9PLEO|nr:hypothetical protein OPT61_g2072 [Boeremia exigua]